MNVDMFYLALVMWTSNRVYWIEKNSKLKSNKTLPEPEWSRANERDERLILLK